VKVGTGILASFPVSVEVGLVIGGLAGEPDENAESGGIGASNGAVNAALQAGQNVALPARSSAMVTRSLQVGQNTCMSIGLQARQRVFVFAGW
jgi:hypothetical protein